MNYQWKVLPSAPADVLNRDGLPALLSQLLYNRGVEAEDWPAYLEADSRLAADPFLLPDMGHAVLRVYRALLQGETIAVYGDYDADGITATALLVEGLQALGANVIPYIPNRLEGHGVQAAALASLAAKGASLVITVDGGTSSYEAVAQAQRQGQDIVITDHHTCVGQLPPAVAIVNPKREEADSLQRPLAGVGVAFKLLQALFRGQGREDELAGYYDLVALGTVTDMAPMRGENRYLVKQGLEHLNNPHRPGLQEMYRVAGVQPGGIDARTISWVLGPRINSAGRMEQAYLSYHLLRTSSSEEGRSLALELEQRNSERQQLAEETWLHVREMALPQREAKLILVRSQDIVPGVIGLMAGRLAEEFQRPAVVIRQDKDISRGSARSIPSFDLIAALEECAPLLEEFGGHPQAAGFVLSNANLDAMHQTLVERANRVLEVLDPRPQLIIDTQLSSSTPKADVYQMCQKLAPFGVGNIEPAFLSSGVRLVEAQCVGSGGDHLRFKLNEGGMAWSGIGFGLGQRYAELTPILDIVYQLVVDSWAGAEKLELRMLDFRPAS